LVFGHIAGRVWGLDSRTGATLWEVHPSNDAGPYTAIWGSPTQVGDDIVIGIASNEELVSGITNFQGNGSVALIDPKSGNVLWQTYLIPPDAYASGWRGASVWCSPTYDNS
jgi:hypothetical protein